MIAYLWKRGLLAISCRQLEPVEVRHADVDQTTRDTIVFEKLLDASFGGARLISSRQAR